MSRKTQLQRMADTIEARVSGPAAMRHMADQLVAESAARSVFVQIQAALMARELRTRADRADKDPTP